MKPVRKKLKNNHLPFFSFLTVLLVLFITSTAFAGPQNEMASEQLQFRKTPYLIYTGNNSQVKVMWQLNQTATCSIRWGTDISYSSKTENTKEYNQDHQHAIIIKKLTPGTKYFYKVTAGVNDYASEFYSASKKDAKNIKFFVYGDTRSFPYVHNKIASAIVSAYKKDPALQTIALFVGDMVTFGGEELNWDSEIFHPAYTHIREMMASLPIIACVGNHELYTKDDQSTDLNFTLFKKYFPYSFVRNTYWSVDYGPAHFVILDQYSNDPEAKQIEWLIKDLQSTKKPWKFVCLHEPGWSAGVSGEGSHQNNTKVQKVVQPILEKYNVTAVFAGNNHYYARAKVNNVYHITTGGGGAPLYDPQPYSPKVITTSKSYHYCIVDIDKNTMVFKALKPDGTVIDTFTLNVSMKY